MPSFSNDKDNRIAALRKTSQAGCTRVVKSLNKAESKSSAEHREYGAIALGKASQNGHVDIVKALFKAGANRDVKRKDDGVTPLWIACQEGHVDVVEVLIAARANPNLPNTVYNVTPLWIACQEGHIEIVKLLLEAQAYLDFESLNDACIVADENYHADILELLQKAKADFKLQYSKGTTPMPMAHDIGYLKATQMFKSGKEASVSLDKDNPDSYEAEVMGSSF